MVDCRGVGPDRLRGRPVCRRGQFVLHAPGAVPTARAVVVRTTAAFTDETDEEFLRFIGPAYPSIEVVDDVTSRLGRDVLSVGILDHTSAEDTVVLALTDLRSALSVMATSPNWVDVVSPTADD